MSEYLRPWKLITLFIGIGILIVGAYIETLPDWDIGISIIMGVLTYLTAPFTVRTIIRMDWKMTPIAVFLAWFSIDGSYWLYHALMGNAMVREANAYASTPLYFIMGIFWMWNGTLKEFIAATTLSIRPKPPSSPAPSESSSVE